MKNWLLFLLLPFFFLYALTPALALTTEPLALTSKPIKNADTTKNADITKNIETIQMMVDPKMTPDSGAKDLLAIHKSLNFIEHKYYFKPLPNNFGSFLSRLVDTYLWTVINSVTMVTQHEVFGHGYRIRDIGTEYFTHPSYKIKFDSGETRFGVKKTDPFQMSAIDSAGVEANAILAKNVKMDWLKQNRISPLETSLYWMSFHDITFYIYSTKFYSEKDYGHDINAYILDLNQTYPADPIRKATLRKGTKLNFFEPFTYLSFASWVYYLFSGKEMPLYMIPIGQAKYLPGLRYGLTPFGPENYLENFLITPDKKAIYFYLRYGDHAGNKYYGAGLEARELVAFLNNKLTFGLILDLFRQPKILNFNQCQQFTTISGESSGSYEWGFDYPVNDLHKTLLGTRISLTMSYQPFIKPFFLELEAGYKHRGFVGGESLKEAAIIKGGFAAQF